VKKTQFYKILFLVSFWVLAGIFYEFFQGTIAGFDAPTTISDGRPYHFQKSMITAVLVVFFSAIVVASFDVLYFSKMLRRKSLGTTLIAKTTCYLFSIFLFSSIGVILILSKTTGQPIFHEQTISLYQQYLTSPTLLLIMLYWGIAVILGLSVLHIGDKFGQGVLLNFILGRYHRPKEEERIFMFLDLTSSSRIAEILGTRKYSTFLRDFFYDIDDVVLTAHGAIFQFVGDEVVIIWDVKNGVNNNNCVKFFFMAEQKIYDLKERYIDKYGLYPEFKAGLHYGKVVITEVGGSKQDIAYHGDTVNTTARIRSECENSDCKLLISAELLGILSHIDDDFFVESKGVFNLKGKKNIIGLFSVKQKKNHQDKHNAGPK